MVLNKSMVGKAADLINPFSSNVQIHTPWKHQKTSGFLMLSGGVEVENWLKMS